MRLRELPGVDRALAAGCALVLLADCLWKGSAQAHPVLAIALSCAACAPLAWRSLAPLGSLAASMVGLIACAVALDSGDGSVAVALVPLYTVSALGARRRSIAVAVLMTDVLGEEIVEIENTVDYRWATQLNPVGALAGEGDSGSRAQGAGAWKGGTTTGDQHAAQLDATRCPRDRGCARAVTGRADVTPGHGAEASAEAALARSRACPPTR